MSRRSLESAAVVPTASDTNHGSHEIDTNAVGEISISNLLASPTLRIKRRSLSLSATTSATAGVKNGDEQSSVTSPPPESVDSSINTQLYKTKSIYVSTKPTTAKRSIGSKLVKNYQAIASTFKYTKRFTRGSDGTYPATTVCVLCTTGKLSCVFFPCQHMCVCNNCITTNDMSPDFPMQLDRCICPVCKADIHLILPHTGTEEMEYWDWVTATKPVLPSEFKFDFKIAGMKLSGNSIVESRASTFRSATRNEFRSVSNPDQLSSPAIRRSYSTPTMTRRMSAYKLGASKKQESCLIL